MTEAETKASAAAEARAASEEAERDEAMEQFAEADPEIARLEAEKADLTDRLLRVAADMENLRRRTERDLADARKYAVAQFAADMLVVADNLRRALEAVPEGLRESGDEGAKALIEGVEMTAREMARLLEKNGILRINAKGERFDPHRHQAMFEAPDASVPAGTVVEVVQDGYQIGDRVLRAALVGVSKGGKESPAGG
jgi:molecular chaperone GrpE